MTNWYTGQLVGHTILKNMIGIVKVLPNINGDITVAWFDYTEEDGWCTYNQQWCYSTTHVTETIPIFPDPYQKALEKLIRELRGKEENVYKLSDSPLIRKIKLLDYQWELRMKEKGNFFLTSPAPAVEAETI